MATNNFTVTFSNGQMTVGMLLAAPKEFKTGSTGFFAQGKIQDTDGKRYQVQIQMVEIGSKPAESK